MMSSGEHITSKTPVKYWGGKQQLAKKIIALIPPHRAYIEPFFGGGAVFFAKETSRIEIINDLNDNIVNFYRIIKRDFHKLHEELDLTLYSEWEWKRARQLWKNGFAEDKVLRAWAVFVLSWQSFSGNIGKSWAFSDEGNKAKTFDNMKQMFDERYVRRLQNVQIFSRDALNVIQNTDHAESFFFVDPPYYNSEMGHYDGYSEQDFIKLLELLSTLEGKFLLTTYPSSPLEQYTAKHGWHTIHNEMHLSASKTAGKKKIEVFTMNYAVDDKLGLISGRSLKKNK